MPAALFSSLLSNERHRVFYRVSAKFNSILWRCLVKCYKIASGQAKAHAVCEQKIMKNEMNFARLRKPRIGNFLRGYMLTITMSIPASIQGVRDGENNSGARVTENFGGSLRSLPFLPAHPLVPSPPPHHPPPSPTLY